jgi:hypothetical protein
MITIAFVNESTRVSDVDVRLCMGALQAQIIEDYYPTYGTLALLEFRAKGSPIPKGTWELVFADNSPQAQALGYHETTANGDPIGYCFVGSDLDAGESWTVTASHEMLEMLGDPDIQLVEEEDNNDGSFTMRMHEMCDACEDDSLAYTKKQSDGTDFRLSDGSSVLFSDFVLPPYWDVNAPAGSKFDFQGKISAPFQILTGGYMGILQIPAGPQWGQITADKATGQLVPGGKTIVPLNRRARRMTPDRMWKRSTR